MKKTERWLVSKEEARLLFWLSPMGFVSGIVGIQSDYPWLGAGTVVGAMLALLYWNRPTYSWRRNVDIAWIQLLLWTHGWYALQSPVAIPYFCIQSAGVVAYGMSWYYQVNAKAMASVKAHAIVHVCANASVILLYMTPSIGQMASIGQKAMPNAARPVFVEDGITNPLLHNSSQQLHDVF